MKKINTILIVLANFISIIYLLFNINTFELSKILIILTLIPILLGIRIIRKILKLKINDSTELVYILFIIGAQLLGSIFEWYDVVPFYDKIVHFLSGILSSIFALVILNNTKLKNRTVVTDVAFIIVFALSVACLWECFEYTSDLILKGDVQNVLTTGVNDTMQDMICAFIASLIYSAIYNVKYKKLVKN